MSAGPSPWKKAAGPSVLRMSRTVWMIPRRFSTTFLVEPLAASGETVVRTVCRV